MPSSDPNPQPELPLRQHLEKLSRVKQMGQSQESREAGKGVFQRKCGKTEPLVPPNQEMQRGGGVEDAAGDIGEVLLVSSGMQEHPPPTSDQRRPPLKNQSSHESGLLRANQSPVLARQSSHEPLPSVRAGGPSSEPPLRAGGHSSERGPSASGQSSQDSADHLY